MAQDHGLGHGNSDGRGSSLTNYIAFKAPSTGSPRIGHLHRTEKTIQPLAFSSGTPLSDLYQVIHVGEAGIIASGEPVPLSSAIVLPPISGRDILCVGKNYAEHAKEFNSSGFDSSDKVDQPTHPVIFTKRFTSIIADGEDIYPHPEFTQTADYEGELGVIVGKAGFRINEADAMDHVWGYTIINDITARERQRDHKQFYIGKSADTYCPMGPIAVPADKLDKVLRVQTHVNGESRQDATTDDLIFSIPYLIMTLSEGQTLMPGDVLATGTPAGVGIGRKPPVYLKQGDEITVSITGLGKLTNRIATGAADNRTMARVLQAAQPKHTDTTKAPGGGDPTKINGKMLNYRRAGTGPPVVFVHGLGGTTDYWTPLIHLAELERSHTVHLADLEGHGQSPTSPLQTISIESLATDINGLFETNHIPSGATLVAHSMGCLVAVQFVLSNSGKVAKLILLGPPPSPLPESTSKASFDRADTARSKGMAAVVDSIASAGTSEQTKTRNPVALTAVRLSLLGQDPEGYAKMCAALAATARTEAKLDFGRIEAETLIITGDEDEVSPPQLCEGYAKSLHRSAGVEVLNGVGHWHIFEDPAGVSRAVRSFI